MLEKVSHNSYGFVYNLTVGDPNTPNLIVKKKNNQAIIVQRSYIRVPRQLANHLETCILFFLRNEHVQNAFAIKASRIIALM